jgi:hypothetical protein
MICQQSEARQSLEIKCMSYHKILYACFTAMLATTVQNMSFSFEVKRLLRAFAAHGP